ncbi:hypothetical protein [Azonexus sp.]|jgi:hypothetical protein|nr:hypothetical protein [Azonexus sp.]MDR1995734.1 hypothetical protein [Azonexus sp.]
MSAWLFVPETFSAQQAVKDIHGFGISLTANAESYRLNCLTGSSGP